MKFALLKEFLLGDTTQKAFAKKKNLSAGTMAWHLRRDSWRLLRVDFIDTKKIKKDKNQSITSTRNNRLNWLKAISDYEEFMLKDVKVDNRKISELTVSEFMDLCRTANALM